MYPPKSNFISWFRLDYEPSSWMPLVTFMFPSFVLICSICVGWLICGLVGWFVGQFVGRFVGISWLVDGWWLVAGWLQVGCQLVRFARLYSKEHTNAWTRTNHLHCHSTTHLKLNSFDFLSLSRPFFHWDHFISKFTRAQFSKSKPGHERRSFTMFHYADSRSHWISHLNPRERPVSLSSFEFSSLKLKLSTCLRPDLLLRDGTM